MRTSAAVNEMKTRAARLFPRGDALQHAVEKIERDVTDDLIGVLALCRHVGMSRAEAASILADVWDAPWSRDARTRER